MNLLKIFPRYRKLEQQKEYYKRSYKSLLKRNGDLQEEIENLKNPPKFQKGDLVVFREECYTKDNFPTHIMGEKYNGEPLLVTDVIDGFEVDLYYKEKNFFFHYDSVFLEKYVEEPFVVEKTTPVRRLKAEGYFSDNTNLDFIKWSLAGKIITELDEGGFLEVKKSMPTKPPCYGERGDKYELALLVVSR